MWTKVENAFNNPMNDHMSTLDGMAMDSYIDPSTLSIDHPIVQAVASTIQSEGAVQAATQPVVSSRTIGAK